MTKPFIISGGVLAFIVCEFFLALFSRCGKWNNKRVLCSYSIYSEKGDDKMRRIPRLILSSFILIYCTLFILLYRFGKNVIIILSVSIVALVLFLSLNSKKKEKKSDRNKTYKDSNIKKWIKIAKRVFPIINYLLIIFVIIFFGFTEAGKEVLKKIYLWIQSQKYDNWLKYIVIFIFPWCYIISLNTIYKELLNYYADSDSEEPIKINKEEK